jgi:hypothetical protein
MADPILLFFLLANILLILKAIKFFNDEKILEFLSFSILIGLSIAMATGTKLNGGMTLIIWAFTILFFLLMSLIKGIQKKKKILLLFSGLLISILSFYSFFVFLNPYLYPNPLNRSIDMINHRLTVASHQQKQYTNEALLTPRERFSSILNATLIEKWKNFKLPFLDLLLLISGLVLLLVTALRKLKKGQLAHSELTVFFWILFCFGLVTIYIPMDWPRYYLPIIPCIIIGQSYALSKIVSL